MINTIDTINKSEVTVTLQSLRQSIRNEQITLTEFLLNAAELYVSLEKPLRAKALLKKIDETAISAEQSAHYALLKRNLYNLPPSPNKSCSLNMIVKNEEKSITRALDSVDLIMDEMVICDTGSGDQTVTLAGQYGVTVIHDPWENDFSRARNRAIEASTCDWIFWMDADDRLEEASMEPLQRLWQEPAPQGMVFCIINERENTTPVEFIQVRLFPRDPDIRFEQKIHEQIMYSIARKKLSFTHHPEIRIHHIGYYSVDAHRKKARRNKPLLVSEIKKNPEDPTLQLSLADCLMALDETDKAKKLYKKVTKNYSAWKKNPDVFVQAHINLARVFLRQKDPYNAKRYFLRSLYLDGSRIESYYALAKIYLDEEKESKAAAFFMKSARVSPPLRLTATDNLKIRLESVYYLAELLIKWRRYSEAESILRPAIKIYPMVPQYFTQMGKALFLQNNMKESAYYYSQSILLSPANNDDAYTGMAEIYSIIGDNKTAEAYLQKMHPLNK